MSSKKSTTSTTKSTSTCTLSSTSTSFASFSNSKSSTSSRNFHPEQTRHSRDCDVWDFWASKLNKHAKRECQSQLDSADNIVDMIGDFIFGTPSALVEQKRFHAKTSVPRQKEAKKLEVGRRMISSKVEEFKTIYRI